MSNNDNVPWALKNEAQRHRAIRAATEYVRQHHANEADTIVTWTGSRAPEPLRDLFSQDGDRLMLVPAGERIGGIVADKTPGYRCDGPGFSECVLFNGWLVRIETNSDDDNSGGAS